jgi:ribose transport system ATP-binding protein
MTPELLSFDGIEKSFFGVRVLKQIRFSIGAGRIVGLVGENGAGKSTLMNVLGGNLQPDAGMMRFNSSDFAPQSPIHAKNVGIGFVHQELNLFTNLSIAENLFITDLPTTGLIIKRAESNRRATELLKNVGLNLSPETLVERLSSGERQLVEIARALSFNARLLILDEPTTSLSTRECERFFALIRELRDAGRSIIFISHALGDVLRLCDDLVVLRDGEIVGQGVANEFDSSRLVSLMVGRELKQLFPERQGSPTEETLLEARNVSQSGIVRDISFTLHRGEVLGLSGLMGAGRTELARILFGLDPHAHGEIRVEGDSLRSSPQGCVQQGMALLSESRREDGLCLEASVADNMALVTLRQRTKTPARLIDFAGVRDALSRIREAVRLQPAVQLDQPVQTLSGGNQQKVVLAKWLLTKPKVLILDEPTRGIDVAAKFEIYQLILELADSGAGVLLISSEIEELTGLCDRIFVMSRGQMSAEFCRAEFDPKRILQAALAGHDRREVAS